MESSQFKLGASRPILWSAREWAGAAAAQIRQSTRNTHTHKQSWTKIKKKEASYTKPATIPWNFRVEKRKKKWGRLLISHDPLSCWAWKEKRLYARLYNEIICYHKRPELSTTARREKESGKRGRYVHTLGQEQQEYDDTFPFFWIFF